MRFNLQKRLNESVTEMKTKKLLANYPNHTIE